jgi:signal transduction histidine kinase
METTIRGALRLQSGIDYSDIGVVAAVGLLLAVGSLSLLRRVIRPTLELTRVARRFGQGDFSARATVTQDDELGALCRTFNHMAEDTASHERARLEFVAMVAHDLKSPLITIGGGARRLRSGKLTPEQHAAWLDRIITQAARLEKLTHDLMDTVQVSTGRLSVNKARLDLAALLREVCREQAEIFSDHSLRVEGDEECPVLGDRDRLERVATNLISNAAKYSPAGSTIGVKVARQKLVAVFTVCDQGAGIAAEDLKVVFEPFGRGSQAHQMAKGTGLGMNVVKHILEAHDGSITIRSELGKGTTVEVTLPLALT